MPQTAEAETGLSDQGREEEQYPADWEERRRQVLQRDDFTCQLCGRRGGPYAEEEAVFLHAHHTVAPSQGGTNAVDNLITLCDACYEHHHRNRRGDSSVEDGDAWLSLGALAGTWVALVGTTAGALEFGSALVGDALVGVNPFAALAVAVVLFAVSLRFLSTYGWGTRLGVAGALLTWLVPLRASGQVEALPAEVGRPSVFAFAVLITVFPVVVAQFVDSTSLRGDEA